MRATVSDAARARAGVGRVLDRVAFVNEVVVFAALVANLAVTFSNTIGRYVLNAGIPWATDFATVCLSLIAFPGAAAFFRRSDGMAYTAFIDRFGPFANRTLRAVGLWLLIAVCCFALYVFPPFFRAQLSQVLPVLGISHAFVSMWLGLGLALMVVYAFEKIVRLGRPSIALGLAAVAAVGVLAAVFRWAYLDGAIDIDPLLPTVVVIVIAFLAGTPVAFVLAAGGALYFLIKGDVPMAIVPAAFQAGIGGFLLLSIPFFMVAGALMEISGMARRLVDMVQHWVGHWTGGLLMSTVGATYMFSLVSGVKAADISTVGTIMKKPMREHGYPSTEFAAVLAASVAMADSVPPSVAMLILGSVTTLSVGALFVAGFLPAAILAIALLIAVAIRSRMKGFGRGPRFDLRRALHSLLPALPALGVPVIIIGALVGGVASPTEAASFAVVYGVIAVVLLHRSIERGVTWPALRDATLVAAMVLVMIGTSHLLVQAIVIAGLGRTLAEAFAVFKDPVVFLLISVLALVVIGFVLEGFPAILVTAPILLPVAQRMGVDPLQFGVLLLMAIGVGVMMPPVGLGYYIACAVTGAPVNATMRPSWIYNAFLIAGLVVVALVPSITLWLPAQFGLHGAP